MTREEAVNVLRNTWLNAGRVNGKTVFAEALNMAIKALETQPDGDAISRRAAIDAIHGIGRLATTTDNDAVIRMSAVEYVLFNLPSACNANWW